MVCFRLLCTPSDRQSAVSCTNESNLKSTLHYIEKVGVCARLLLFCNICIVHHSLHGQFFHAVLTPRCTASGFSQLGLWLNWLLPNLLSSYNFRVSAKELPSLYCCIIFMLSYTREVYLFIYSSRLSSQLSIGACVSLTAVSLTAVDSVCVVRECPWCRRASPVKCLLPRSTAEHRAHGSICFEVQY